MPTNNSYGFIIRPQHKYLQEVLNYEQLGKLWVAIMEYIQSGSCESINFDSDVEKLAFLSIQAQIDKDKEQYNKRCEINRKNGNKGGRPPKETAAF